MLEPITHTRFTDSGDRARQWIPLTVLKLLTLLALLAPCATGTLVFGGEPVAAGKRPNIVFLLSDDQRVDTIAALGNRVIKTPHLDSLVRQGTVFRRAHCANPLCVPSRAEILTGARGFTNGVMMGNKLNETLALWPEVMQQAGYQTWYVGKWHTSGRPSSRGYSASRGLFSSGGGKFWKDHNDFKNIPVTGYRGWIFQTDDRKLDPSRGVGLTASISEHFADAAVQFIRNAGDKPYFLHVNFTAPHDPLVMPPGYEQMYPPASIPLPANFRARHPFDHGNIEGRDEKMLPWPRTEQAVKQNLAMYYRVITHMDSQIGKILEVLRQTGQEKNTIVIFASDHGLAVGSHGLMGKQSMYEHTILVPMIFRGPNIPQGQQRNTFCYLRDLFPTACDLSGINLPETVQGKSLKPAIENDTHRLYSHAYGYFRNAQRMVRDEQYKLVDYPQISRQQLFDTKSDPDELNDLAASDKHRAIRDRLQRQLATWQEHVGDPVTDK